MDSHNYEREVLDVSRKLLLRAAFESAGLESVVDQVCPKVAVAALYIAGELVAEGAGKGNSCEVGALAEAFEHYSLRDDGSVDIVQVTASQIAEQIPVQRDGILKSLGRFDECIEGVKFQSLVGEECLIIPQMLVCPCDSPPTSACETFLERYSTNSGAALGCSLDEAILHGLNEVVERHILSLVMLNSIGSGGEIDIFEISQTRISELLDVVDVVLIGNIRVYFVDMLLGGFFCVAVRGEEKHEFSLPQIGSGFSQSFLLAFSRAVHELIQAETLYGYEERCVDEQAIRVISCSKRLGALRTLQISSSKVVDYTPELYGRFSHRPDKQVESALASLQLAGFNCYFRVLSKLGGSVVVVQVYIPGMERFNLIRSGKWVAPHSVLLKSPFEG